jgi:hypothetical protein
LILFNLWLIKHSRNTNPHPPIFQFLSYAAARRHSRREFMKNGVLIITLTVASFDVAGVELTAAIISTPSQTSCE